MAGGRYAVEAGDRPESAELAFLTGEAYRGRGIAGVCGISRFSPAKPGCHD